MASNDEQQQQQPIHILFFPFVAPGHLIPVASMAALFASRGVKCTILTTPVNAAVIRSAVDQSNNAFRRSGTDAPAIRISTIPFPDVGLPPGVESVAGISSPEDLVKLLEGFRRLREPFDRFLAEAEHRPDAAVVDSFYSWAADAAAEHGVPRLSFLGTSLFARACHDSLLRNDPLALAPDDPDAVVSLPELPHRVALRRSQLLDPRKSQWEWDFYQVVHAADRRSYGEVFNSFAELEPGYVEHYRTTLGRRVWLVGPVHAHASAAGEGEDIALGTDSDRCLRWLDEKPRGSVVYLSFGTLAHFSAAERREIARGLQLSGKNFLWVMTGGAADDTTEEEDASEWMPEGFAELIDIGAGARGVVFRGWAPQRHILEHSAVGGFMTHCGWNSVLEAVTAGVPMVTWPRNADQFYIEKLIVEVLKIGVGVGAADYASKFEVRREVISGEKIAEGIEGVMGGSEGAEAIRKELCEKARSAIEKGGTSYDDVGKLIHELMARRRPIHL